MINNCVVRAIHAVTGEAPEDIVAGLAAFPVNGVPAFIDGGVRLNSISTYFEANGWEEILFEYRNNRPPIPWTCVIHLIDPCHAFAIIDGRIHDEYNGGYCDSQIVSVFVPPADVMRRAERRGGAVPKI